MIFGRRQASRFDDLDPDKGPGIEAEIRSNARHADLVPTLPVGPSRDGCQLEIVRFDVSRTFDDLEEGRPWAMSVEALRRADHEADAVLDPWYWRIEDAPPGTEATAIALPPFRVLATLLSHDHVPEEDESCCGSRATVVWFTEALEGWTERFARELAERLDWRPIAGPLWRDTPDG